MKKILLGLCGLVILGIVVLSFKDEIEHLIEGNDHQSEKHVSADKAKNEAKHGHGPEAKEAGHGQEEEGHKKEGHVEKGHSEEEGAGVRLTAKQIKLAGIVSVEATLGRVDLAINLAGEVRVDQNRVVQVVPRVPGVVRSVRSFLGDQVKKNAVMAVLDSRELADAKSAYVAANEKSKLARSSFRREEKLWKKRISSEQEYLNAKSALSEARIAERTASQKLRALGTSSAALKRLAKGPAESLTHYEIVAPLAGTIIEKHVTNGASVDQREPIFRIADLNSVWVIASVYEKDIARMKKGQTASVTTKAYRNKFFEGRITWVADTLDERTRTLKVRIEVDNTRRLLKPGMFVQASVVVDAKDGVVSIPAAAVRRQGSETIVFVDEGGGRFERREVEIGDQVSGRVEIRKGVKPGERIVAEGSFILKSELEKEGFGGDHGH